MGVGMKRQVTDRELAWYGVLFGGLFSIFGVLKVLVDPGLESLAITGLGVTCLALGWKQRKARHDPDTQPTVNETLRTFGKWLGNTLRRLKP